MSCIPAPTCKSALAEATRLYPNRSRASDGICASATHSSQNSSSDHERGDAFDITHDPANGCDAHLLAEMVKARGDQRVRYIISKGRIWNPSISYAWRTYSGINPHNKHAHFSIHSSARNDTKPWWPKPEPAKEWDEMATEAQVEEAAKRAAKAAFLEVVPQALLGALPKFTDGMAFTIQPGDTKTYAFKMVKNQVAWMQSYEPATVESQWTDANGNHLPRDTHTIDRKGVSASLAPGASGFVVKLVSGSHPLLIQIFSQPTDFE